MRYPGIVHIKQVERGFMTMRLSVWRELLTMETL